MRAFYFQKYQGGDNQWYWRLRAGNNETVAAGEGYTTEQGVDRAIAMLQDFGENLSQAEVKLISNAQFQQRRMAMKKATKTIKLLDIVKALTGRKR